MRKYKWWFNIAAGYLWLLAADFAFFVLTGMTFFDPNPALIQLRLGTLVVGGVALGFVVMERAHLKEDKS